MKDIRISDLIDLVDAGAIEPEKRIEKIFDWQIQRQMEIAKWFLGAAASLGIGIVIASTSSTAVFTAIHWALAGVAIVALGGFGTLQFIRGKKLSECFLSSIVLLNRLAKLRQFIARYRSMR